MASKEHLKILMGGRSLWQQWRAEHPEVTPDLKGASLNGLEVDFDLSGTNFPGADLSDANIAVASLADANLANANLTRADVGMSNLERAVLYKATLGGAQFDDSHLKHVDLRGARCISRIFVERT